MIDYQAPVPELPVGCVASHFFDSGAFTLWTKAAQYAEKNNADQWAFYDTDEHWEYVDKYAFFVKRHKIAIDHYANVDVIPNAKLTWRNQRYLENTHDLHPVPVVHYPCDLKWLRKYMDLGYDFIGLGGLVGSSSQDECRAWIDRVFEIVCDSPGNMPKVKIHGFGVTGYDLLLRYPWYSVDSASWTKIASFGGILVPHKRKGKWDFTEQPYIMKVSEDSPDRKARNKHLLTLSPMSRGIIESWLAEIGIAIGKQSKGGEVLEWGVTTHHTYRKVANLLFFERMRKALPEWPWPFKSVRRKNLWGV